MDQYKKFTLKNGLRLIVVPAKSTEVVTTLVMFGVGSRDESDENAGISHLLEHMHYKGTKKRPEPSEVSEFIDSIGAEHNAFTDKEVTGYYVKTVPDHMEAAFDFISDNLLHSTFDPKELKKEKNVILQEIDMYEDLSMVMVGTKFEEAVFGKNSLGRDVIGFKESVSAATRQDLINYKNSFYNTESAVVVIAGNPGKHSVESLKKLVYKYFKLPSNKSKKNAIPVLSETKGQKIIQKQTEQSQLAIGFRTVPLKHSDNYILDLISVILGGSMSSRMFKEIREKRGLAYSVKTHMNTYSCGGSMITQAGVHDDKVYEAAKAIIGEYKKLINEKVGKSELLRAKEIVRGKTMIKFEDSEELALYYALEEVLTKNVKTPGQILEKYKKITAEDIQKTAKKYFVDSRAGLSFVGKKIDKEKLEKIFKI